MLGHSDGGYMTAYAITPTNRFKGGVIHDSCCLSLMTGDYFPSWPDGWRSLLLRDLFGIYNPFDPAERVRLLEESPLLNADRVRTPTLLLNGGVGCRDR